MDSPLLPFYVLTVIGQIFILKLLYAGLFPKAIGSNLIISFAKDFGVAIVTLSAFLATAGSLYFSEVLRFEPCLLCWWQRIAMYPQLFIAGVGLNNKDKGAFEYIGTLSVVGLAIALVHYFIQIGGVPENCSLAGAIACSQTPFLGFGYITIPLMAATAFAINLLVVWINKKR